MNLKRLWHGTRFAVILMLACALAWTSLPTTAHAGVPTVAYQASVQGKGWMPLQRNGTTAGSTAKTARLEALKFKLPAYAQKKGSLVCRVHIAGKGWQAWRALGAVAGYVGKGKSIDAVRIKLTGTLATKYDIVYRTHVSGIGWLGGAKKGASAGGTNGVANVGALRVKFVPKGQIATSGNAYIDLSITRAIKLKHYMTRSLCQLDYPSHFQHGGCCAMSYAVGISIITKRDVNPLSYYRKDWFSPSVYLCYFDDGHIATGEINFNAEEIYDKLRAGKPTLVHYTYSTGQHWVCITGVRAGVNTSELTYADFTAIDPYYGTERALSKCSMFGKVRTVTMRLMS